MGTSHSHQSVEDFKSLSVYEVSEIVVALGAQFSYMGPLIIEHGINGAVVISSRSVTHTERSLREIGVIDSMHINRIISELCNLGIFTISRSSGSVAPSSVIGSAINTAAEMGDTARLRPLVEEWSGNPILNWADLDKRGQTPLIQAARGGFLEIVQLLVEHGADVNVASSSGKTALSWSAYKGHVQIVQFLLAQEGIDVNKPDNHGSTALIKTALCGNIELVRMLLKHGADPNKVDNCGAGPLSYASNDHIEALLWEKGAR